MGDEFELLADILPFLIPVIILEIILLAIALVDLLKRERRDGNTRIGWLLVIILLGIIGPILYFIFGRKASSVHREKDL